MRPIWVRKSFGQWEQGMVVAMADMAVPFLSFLCSSLNTFLLVSQTYTPHLMTSCYMSLFCTRYFWQLGVKLKDFMETFSVSLKGFFWPLWKCLPWDSSPLSSFFGRWWSFMRTAWPAQQSCDCIKMVKMLGRKAQVKSSVSGMHFCNVIPRIFLRQVVWKWFSFAIDKSSTFHSHKGGW